MTATRKFPLHAVSTKEECEAVGLPWEGSVWVTIRDAVGQQVASVFVFNSIEENMAWAQRICDALNAQEGLATPAPR